MEDGDLHEEQEPGEGTQRAPALERENVQPAPGLELIGQEMVKPPGSGKGSAATRARPAGVGSGGDGAGREMAEEQVPATQIRHLCREGCGLRHRGTRGQHQGRLNHDKEVIRIFKDQQDSRKAMGLEYYLTWRSGELGGDERSSVEAAGIPAPGAASASGCGSGGRSISEADGGEQEVEGGKRFGGDLHDAGPAQRQGRGGGGQGWYGGVADAGGAQCGNQLD